MQPFIHIQPSTLDEARSLLDADTRPLAGGTDLLPLMKEGVAAPRRLVNLKGAPELGEIRAASDGLHIGALATLSELQHNAEIGRSWTALAEAAGEAASPQLRNMATIGGNLLQQARCWYYRGDFHCWLKGGAECHARNGRNEQHAIFDRSPCVAVYPSDPPAALIAFDARLRIFGPGGEREVLVADFLAPPSDERRAFHTLAPDELIVEVLLPAAAREGPTAQPGRPERRSRYLKAMDRAVWAYALASVAVVADVRGRALHNVHVVLGGVANIPLRAAEAEALLEGQAPDAALARRAGEAAVAAARPLEHNRYKVPLVRNLVAQAVTELGIEN